MLGELGERSFTAMIRRNCFPTAEVSNSSLIRILVPVSPLNTTSDLRQVPDNQEVFLSPSSETSVIVEILSMVEEGEAQSDLWEAAK